ncbi:type IV secretory system conjugative DNA transfer family protein (plasmid) [Sphingomonas naphthae]|jgi:type IV secretion system protein VirD4|uniref:Type IV secretory system conjugative DNA transfer family protein n=1 Tax=Sphingomonas naphthae TaxID=1813468 RepID=A0ABY7TRK0_9SPHN|nr:type IV secretory system conjugative DNA transfer family protein [Sphingomonas naphthae]WCT75843.1 type IV secretory system conjugative DNA transfer family protein [Sphingomonas naphthae]
MLALAILMAWIAGTLLIALIGLRQIGPQMQVSALPAWLWYYREDPLLFLWLKRGALICGGIIVLAALVILRRRRPLHGEARFAREAEIRREQLRSTTGIIVGQKGGRYLVFGGTEHVLLEAPTRAGKGVGVVIPNLLSWPDSVVVLDVKRENWELTAGFRARHGQRVHLFDPLDPESRSARYNPLSYIERTDDIDVVNELQKIAGMLFPAPEKSDPFWAEAARGAFVGVGALVAANPALPFTIGEIYRRLTAGDPKVELPRALEEAERVGQRLSQACRSALSDFTSASDNTFSGIKQTITSKLNLWLNPYVDAATSETDFDLRQVRRERMSIYLGVSPDNIDRIAPVYNLFLQQLVDLNTRELPESGGRIPVLILLDEFARLGKAPVIASAFSYVAGYGLRLLPVIQSRSQPRAIYGPDVTDEIIANCGLEIIFTPKELKVANELSDRLGFFTMNVKSKSRTIHGMLANRSISESDQRRALMMPQELMQMPKSELLLLRGGIPPVRGRKIEYFRVRRFTNRISPPPKVAPRAITNAPAHAPSAASGQASPGNDPLVRAREGKIAALRSDPANTAMEEDIIMTRPMSDPEISGEFEITDDMLVLGDLADLPAPGDEAAAIAFVMAMSARAVGEGGTIAASDMTHIQERSDNGR